MTRKLRLIAWALAAAFGIGVLTPTAARASRKGRRNTALALGAAGLYGVATKKWWLAALGLGSGVYLYTHAGHDRHRRRRYARHVYYPARYGRYYYVPRRYRGRRVVYYTPRRYYYAPRSRVAGFRTERRWVHSGWSHGRKTGWRRHGH